MLDQSTRKGRILAAALGCAAKKNWSDVSCSISRKRPMCRWRSCGPVRHQDDIIAALLRAVDDEVMKRTAKRAEGQEKRDLLFDIVMTRFDVLAPHKAALKSIHASGAADFALAGPFSPPSTGCCRPRASAPTVRRAPCAWRASASSTRRCSGSGSRTTIRAWPRPWPRSTGGCGAASARSAASSRSTLPCRASARPCRSCAQRGSRPSQAQSEPWPRGRPGVDGPFLDICDARDVVSIETPRPRLPLRRRHSLRREGGAARPQLGPACANVSTRSKAGLRHRGRERRRPRNSICEGPGLRR